MPHNAYMKSSYDTSVVTPVDQLWAQLTDVDRLVAVLSDCALERDGQTLTGSLKCRLGQHQVTYRIVARATLAGGTANSASIVISGTEARGAGTLQASLTVAANEVGDQTRVELGGDVTATGRGETADARAWAKVMESFLNAVLPEAAASPPGRPSAAAAPAAVSAASETASRSAAAPMAVPRTPTAVEVDPPTAGPSVPTGPIALAAACVLALLLVGRRRRRRRRQ
jgi:uncharacterized protein